MRSVLLRGAWSQHSQPVDHFEVFLVGIKVAAPSDASSLSVALKRPERSFGCTTDSRTSSFTPQRRFAWLIVTPHTGLPATTILHQAVPDEREGFILSGSAIQPSLLCGAVSSEKSPEVSTRNRDRRLLSRAAPLNNTLRIGTVTRCSA